MNRHDEITTAIEQSISDGRFRPGERLPTVRQLSSDLGVSGATVAAAYRSLKRRGLTRGEVGRGTFVADPPQRAGANPFGAPAMTRDRNQQSVHWRRRAVNASATRLQALFPSAMDCTSGKPDPSMLPLELVKRSWKTAIDETVATDLQYAGPEPVPLLAAALEERLGRDGISIDGTSLIVGSSAQQLMVLSHSIVPTLSGVTAPTIAVEEPGYQTVFDAFERHGARLAGMELDDQGVMPDSLNSALAAGGAHAVLFTPRVQNPTGSSWSAIRRMAIANILARYPNVIVIEDDQFADLAQSSPGSLITDKRLEDRVIYIRSFAKTVAPDVRLAVALAKPLLRNMLAEARTFNDGWSSRMAQRALAHMLMDPELSLALASAREVYAARRTLAVDILVKRLVPIGGRVSSSDGLNIWVQLPRGIDAAEVVERAAGMGVLLVSGEPFYIRPGHNSAIRMSVSQLSQEQAAVAANRLVHAALNSSSMRFSVIPV